MKSWFERYLNGREKNRKHLPTFKGVDFKVLRKTIKFNNDKCHDKKKKDD